MNNIICRILSNGTFESASHTNPTLDSMFRADQNYGYMKNKGIITYVILNNDVEVSVKQAEKSFWIAGYSWTLDTKPVFMNIRVFRKKFNNPNAEPMIKVSFKTEDEDEQLTANTIAYMGYPTNGNTFYGILVLNKRYVFTAHGNAIKGTEMELLGIKVQFKEGFYSTMDLDKIFRHELGHGVFGLPHSPTKHNVMSGNESFMAEFNTQEDIARAQNKAGKSSIPQKWVMIIKKFMHIWTE